MALSRSGKSGSNVLNLDDVRRKRSDSRHIENTPLKAASETATPRYDDETPTDDQSDSLCATSKPEKSDRTSAAKTRAVGNRRFDKVKVERIKGELARNEYKINYLQVADKFIEHERYS